LTIGSVLSGSDQACNQVIWGSFVNAIYAPSLIADTIRFDNAVQRSSAIVQSYVNWDDGDLGSDPNNPDFSRWTDFPKWIRSIMSYTSQGVSSHTPLITWQPMCLVKGQETRYSFANVNTGKWDSYITSFGKVINSFNTTILIRYAHEFDGDWYSWGANINGNTPSGFKTAWNRVTRLVKAVAPKAQFVWCPNHSNGKGVRFEDYYPGDASVDWMCLDSYADSTTNSFADTISTAAEPSYPYDRMTKLSKKPIMIAEFGVDANKKYDGAPSVGQWHTSMAESLANHTQIKAVIKFNTDVNGRSFSLAYGDSAQVSAISSSFGKCANSLVVGDGGSVIGVDGASSTLMVSVCVLVASLMLSMM